MKLPMILRTNHDLVVGEFEEEINLRNEELKGKEDIIRTLENKNHKLHTRLIAARSKVEKLEDVNHELHQDINAANEKVEGYIKANTVIGSMYNNINRKLWCDEESKRQLRNLAVDIRESAKINKTDLAKYLEEISMRIGGGEDYKFVAACKEEN